MGLSIGALFLFLTFRQIDLSSCWVHIRNARVSWIFLSLFVYSTGFVLRSFRWKYLLSPLRDFSAKRLFFLNMLGFYMNDFLPLRLGELVRVNVSGKKLNLARSGVLATVVVERLFDGMSFIAFFFLTVLLLPFPEWAKKSFYVGSFVFFGAIVGLFFLSRHKETAATFFAKLPVKSAFVQRLERMFINFLEGLKIFTDFRLILKVIIASLLIWTIEGSVFYIIGHGFSLGLTMLQSFLVLIIIGTGAILPPAPGYVGTVEFLGVTSLAYLGFDKNLAFAYIVTLHVVQLLVVFFWGTLGLFKENITFQELIHIEKKA